MLRVHASGLWEIIARLSTRARSGRAVAVAYFTSDVHVRFAAGDVLIVDADDDTIRRGATSARLLQRLVSNGVHVYSLPGLHAKVYLLGNTAVIGSPNLTTNSTHLIETAVVSDSPEIVAGAAHFVESLRKHKRVKKVDDDFLAHALAIPVARPRPSDFRNLGRDPTLVLRPPRVWLLGLHAIDPDQFPDEAADAASDTKRAAIRMAIEEHDVEWIRFSRSWRIAKEARKDDLVIQLWREDYRDPAPTHVYRATPISMLRRTPAFTRFFPWPQEQRVTWNAFAKHWHKLALGRLPGPNAQRLLSERIAHDIDRLWK